MDEQTSANIDFHQFRCQNSSRLSAETLSRGPTLGLSKVCVVRDLVEERPVVTLVVSRWTFGSPTGAKIECSGAAFPFNGGGDFEDTALIACTVWSWYKWLLSPSCFDIGVIVSTSFCWLLSDPSCFLISSSGSWDLGSESCVESIGIGWLGFVCILGLFEPP